MNITTAIYCRESTDKQDIDSLISLCERKANELGLNDYKVYKDVKSGYSNEREEYLKLIEDIKAGVIKTVIVYESSRLGRDELEHHILYKIFRNYNVKVYNISRGWVDPSNEDDLFLEGILNLLDAREGRKIARRVKDRLKELCMSGQWTGGPAPVGYILKDKKLIVDPEKAKMIKDIFQLFIEGTEKGKIAKIYNLEYKKVGRIISNPVYAGKLKYQQFQKDSNKKRIENKTYEVFKGEHEAIVSEEIFFLANNLLKNTYKEKVTFPAIFRNLLYCNCGKKLYPNEGYKRKRIYVCTDNCISAIKEEEIFPTVINTIENVLNNIDLENIDNVNKNIKERLEFYRNQQKNSEIQLENLTRKYISGQIKEELYDKLSKEINEKINLLLGEIEELNKKISIKESTKNNKEIIFKYLEKIKKEKDKDKINQFFSLIIDKIVFINSYRYIVYLKI